MAKEQFANDGVDKGNHPSPHTSLTVRSFVAFAGTLFAVDLINVGHGAVDLAFVAPFGAATVAGVGLGDLVTGLYMAFFAGVVDVFAVHLAKAEGNGSGRVKLPRLFGALLYVAAVWTVMGVCAARLTPSLFDLVGSEPGVAGTAAGYVAVRMAGILCALCLAAASVALRVLGWKRASVVLVTVGFILNALFNLVVLHSPVKGFLPNPAVAVALATVATQTLTAAVGLLLLLRRVSRPAKNQTAREENVRTASLALALLRTSIGVGIRHMNNYAAAVVPFALISRLDVATIAASTIATKIWTLYCRVPHATLSAASVFVGYARGQSHEAARRVAGNAFGYVAWPSLVAAVLVAAAVPLFTRVLGGEEIELELTWILTAAYLLGVPAYVIENYGAEILTVEQRASWLSVPSTFVTYVVTIPIAIVGVLIMESAFVALLSAAVASALLACVYTWRCRQLGYHVVSFHM